MSDAISQTDRAVIRELARQVRHIAEHPEMDARRRALKAHNALKGDRPLILCFPEGAWSEILTDKDLACTNPLCRSVEYSLRTKLLWRTIINDDATLEPHYDIGWKVKTTNFGFQVPFTYGDNRGSFVWEPPMKDLERDIEKLKHRQITVDREATLAERDLLQELIGDLLPVRIHSFPWWTVGLTYEAVMLVGIEGLMLAMYDQPESVRRLMSFLRDDAMRLLDFWESEGLLCCNDGYDDYVGSGGLGAIDGLRPPEQGDDVPAKLCQRWGFGESQETVGVSGQMFDEFILPYQVPMLERFGLNCYGCCEQLEHRIKYILQRVPRLRRISVAPLANQEKMAEALGGKYIYSRKANPIYVSVDFNEAAIREDLRHTLRVAGDQPLEIILKDTHTVQNEPWRLQKWVQIAREEVDRYMEGKR